MKHKVLKVHPKDNVIVALTNLSKGEIISFDGKEYTLQDNSLLKIPECRSFSFGFKIQTEASVEGAGGQTINA